MACKAALGCFVTAVIAAPAPAATAAVRHHAEPPRSYTGLLTGTRFSDRGESFREEWSAIVTFRRVEVERSPTGAVVGVDYRVSGGTVRWTIGAEGDCPWRQRYRFRLDPGIDNGGLTFRGSRYAIVLAAQVGSVTATVSGPSDDGCESYETDVSPAGDWLGMDRFRKGRPGDPLRGAETAPGHAREYADWSLDGRSTVNGVTADAGGPYVVRRGARITLDASRSRPSREIRAYRWHFKLAGNQSAPPVAAPTARSGLAAAAPAKPRKRCGTDGRGVLTHPKANGKRFRLAVLCPLDVALELKLRQGGTATATTRVTVTPRAGWRTHPTFTPVEQPAKPGVVVPAQALLRLPATDIERPIFGLNVCADGRTDTAFCAPCDEVGFIHDSRSNEDAIQCRETLWERAYEPTRVESPGGPFDGWWYSGATNLPVARFGVLNPWILPGADPPPAAPTGTKNFYEANAQLVWPIDGFLAATRLHEGYGGSEQSGHQQMLLAALRADDAARDPVHYLEASVGSSRSVLIQDNRDCLERLDLAVTLYMRDPLNEVEDGHLSTAALWDGPSQSWQPTRLSSLDRFTERVPGPVGCALESASTP